MRTTFFPVLLMAIISACGNSEGADRDGTVLEAEPTKGGSTAGAVIYNAQCVLCHGRDGRLGLSGAKDLTLSTLSREEMVALLASGKGAMAGYATMLSTADIEAVVDHLRSLPKAE